MSSHPTDFKGDVCAAIRESIARALPDAAITVEGGGGHFTIDVKSASFAGQNTLTRQRAVYGAIAHLMQGMNAPVHAVDTLRTSTP
ncbi:MAG: BolA family transcriptional regulator [Myxococcales bacterium FL481]|nr:MAG: BolA family transcriptional regulator [Myxococcales bacterium FL481]